MDVVVLRRPEDVTCPWRKAMTRCWVEVTNAGGAAGFPFPPVDHARVAPAVEELIAGLRSGESRLVAAVDGGCLVGWVSVMRNPAPIVAHWATVRHLQTLPAVRGRGIGSALMERLREAARDELAVDHLWLTLRGGMGLEAFYRRLGWVETGRHPAALRLGPDDVRDEVFMTLAPL